MRYFAHRDLQQRTVFHMLSAWQSYIVNSCHLNTFLSPTLRVSFRHVGKISQHIKQVQLKSGGVYPAPHCAQNVQRRLCVMSPTPRIFYILSRQSVVRYTELWREKTSPAPQQSKLFTPMNTPIFVVDGALFFRIMINIIDECT